MPKIKYSGGSAEDERSRGLAIQMTKQARSASLIEENDDGDVTYRAPVRVYAFNNFLLFVDRDQVADEYITELVSSAATDTGSIYCASNTRIQPCGNGFQCQLPPIEETGLSKGDKVGLHTADGIVCASKSNGDGAGQAARLGEDVTQLRTQQVAGVGGNVTVKKSVSSLE